MKAICRINGLGMYVPAEVLTNADMEKIVETSDEWIVTRTGIKRRHRAAPGETTSDMAYHACVNLFSSGCGFSAADLTHILVATITPDSLGPSTACNLGAKLGTATIPAFDFNAACSGFLYGLMIARGLVAAEPDAVVLLAASDIITSRVNWQDRSTCVLFGDGAGAAIITGAGAPRRKSGGFSATLDAIEMHADGNIGHYLKVGTGGCTSAPYHLGDTVREDFFIQMEGREVFKHAVRDMVAVTSDLLEKTGLSVEDLSLVIPHQANARIIETVGKKLGIPQHKLFMNVAEYGNTSGVSLLLALYDAYADKRLPAGGRCLLTSFGAGFTWGAALLGIE